MSAPSVLLTGATGQLGGRIAADLLRRLPAGELAVSTRSPERAGDLAGRGVDVRRGDFDDPASLAAAFAGVDRLLLISADGDNQTRIRQHTAAVRAAERAGVGRIYYTSVVRADTSPLPLADVHRATEAAITATGLPHTFLRNTWYLENEAGTVQGVLAGAPVVNPIGEAGIGWLPRADLAEASAAALLADEPEEVYELAGPPRTYRDLAAGLAQALDREVPVVDVDDAAYVRVLIDAGLPAPAAEAFAAMQPPIRAGALDVDSPDAERLLGRPVTPWVGALAALVAAARTGR